MIHGGACQKVQTVPVFPVIGDGELPVGGPQPHHGFKENPAALLNVLPHRVEVGGKFHAGREQALAVLALALAEKLLPPLRHEPEGRVEAGQQLNGESGPVQLVPQGGILPCGTFKGAFSAAGHHVRRAVHQLRDIHPDSRDGQQAHGGQNGVASADFIRYYKGFPALIVRHGFQNAPGLVRGGVDAAAGALTAVFLFQQLPEESEGHGGLRGGAGLGDDVDGEVHVLHQIQHLPQRIAGKAVAHKVDAGRVLFLQIVIGRAQAVDDPTGPQIAAADADDHQRLGVCTDPLGRRLNPGKFPPVIVPGQVNPAGEFPAQTGSGL